MLRSTDTASKNKHVVIVGAGPGGLATAMLLARSGVRVTVVEKQARVGGRTSTLQQDGFSFDIGPTFFLYPRVLKEIFADAGYDLDREVPMERLDPQYRLVFGGKDGVIDGQIDATADVARMEQQIAAISPGDAVEFKNFLAHNRKKLASFLPVLESPFESWRNLLSPSLMKLLPLMKPWLSLDGDLQTHFKDERIRLGFSFQSKYLGMSPFRCPSLFSILSFLEYEHGVFHPIGGCGAVTSAMARICQELGVEFLMEEPVEEIFVAARQSHRRPHLHPHPPGRLRRPQRRLRRRRPQAHSTPVPQKVVRPHHRIQALLLLHLHDVPRHRRPLRLPRPTTPSTSPITTARTSPTSSRATSSPPTPASTSRTPLSPTPPSPPTATPPSTSSSPSPHQTPNVDWVAETPRFRSLAMQQMERIGITGLQSRIRTEKVLTPAGWNTDFGLFKGATFSMAHSLDQMLHLRPHNRFEDVRNMYLTGGGTHPGSGLPVIFQSARISSRLLLEDLGLEPQWSTTPAISTDTNMMQVAS